jgi:hypothetical protein
MHKLKLESLHVQSFQTTVAPPATRGTVQAHAKTAEDCIGTFGPQECGATNYADCSGACSFDCSYQDCTFGCTRDAQVCGATNYLDCSGNCTWECTTGCPLTQGGECYTVACSDYKTC